MNPNVELNYKQLRNVCLAPEKDFHRLGKVINTPSGPLVYINRGSNVLGVAHLDYVPDTDHFYVLKIKGQEVILCGQMDDRLGAYILLHLLPSLGLRFDVLLSTGEESSRSTAEYFKPNKKYNWMFQFDRNGGDVVRYQYDSKNLEGKLNSAGFTDVKHGAFSDICKLSHLGCEGFNVGTGYADEHSTWSRAYPVIIKAQVAKFVQFYNKYRKEHIPYTKPVYASSSTGAGAWWGQKGKKPDFVHPVYKRIERGGIVTWERIDDSPLARHKHNQAPKPPPKNMKEMLDEEAYSDERCTVCHNLMFNYELEKPKYEGVCMTCEDLLNPCVGCGEPYEDAELDEYGICDECLKEVMAVGDKQSILRCEFCGMLMMISEIAEGCLCQRKNPTSEEILLRLQRMTTALSTGAG